MLSKDVGEDSHAFEGELPEEYVPYLGMGFDGCCVRFPGVECEVIKALVLSGESDEEVMGFCKREGQESSD